MRAPKRPTHVSVRCCINGVISFAWTWQCHGSKRAWNAQATNLTARTLGNVPVLFPVLCTMQEQQNSGLHGKKE
jgi:hypothetical protein